MGGQGVAYNSWMRDLNNLSIYCSIPIRGEAEGFFSFALQRLAACLGDAAQRLLGWQGAAGAIGGVLKWFSSFLLGLLAELAYNLVIVIVG